jgi:uncharacterized protein YggE
MRGGLLALGAFVALLAGAIVIIMLVRVPNEVKFRADTAEIAIGCYSEAQVTAEAVQQTAAAMRATLTALRELGARDEDISSTSVRSDLVQSEDRQRPAADQKPLYYAYQSVSLRVSDISRIGKILDAISKAGANYWLVTYKVSDRKRQELEGAAHAAALADAIAKADAYAKHGNFRRGRILKLQDGSTSFPEADYYNRDYRLNSGRTYAYSARTEKITVTGSRIPVKDTTFDVPPPKEETVGANIGVLFEIE